MSEIRGEKVVTALQRPIMFVLMIIATPSMSLLALYSVYIHGGDLINGKLGEGLNGGPITAIILVIAPFLLSWFCCNMLKKSRRLIKTEGVIYKETNS